jgi:hypothetical protein
MRRRNLVALAAGLLALAIGAGAAFAYFTARGSGAGSSSSGTLTTVVLQANAGSPSAPLYPGGTGDVILTVKNPNSYPVTLVSAALKSGGTITPDSNHSSCTTTGVTFSNWSGSVPITAINAATQTIDLHGTSSMSASSASGCQGATFSIPITIAVEKQ